VTERVAERAVDSSIRRRYVDVPFGQVHVVVAGPPASTASPVVLLHQTPRSADEFAEVIPLLAAERPVVAVDLPGMGASDPTDGDDGIEALATGVVAALDGLGIGLFDLVGHHTGGVVAVEIAAAQSSRVGRLVLSSTPYVDGADRERRRSRPVVDAVAVDDGGRFLGELWNGRRAFYPSGRPDLLVRFVADALRVADPGAGHRAVGRYAMEDRLAAIRAPVLLVTHDADPFAEPEQPRLAAALRNAGVAVHTATVAGGMVPLEHTAAAFVAAIAPFLGRTTSDPKDRDAENR
jgi:pimeloyl-ACP methyl ester carboxylesterase